MNVELVEKPDVSRYETWMKITRALIGVFAAAPVVIICVAFTQFSDAFESDMFIALFDLVVYLFVGLAFFLLPALVVAGLLLRREIQKRAPRKMPMTIYWLGGLLWLIYAALLVFLTSRWIL